MSDDAADAGAAGAAGDDQALGGADQHDGGELPGSGADGSGGADPGAAAAALNIDLNLDLEEEEATAFEALEKDFQDVLAELVADKSLEHFRGEYEKLHRAVKKSHESEKRLIKKCRELNGEIQQNAVRVQTALRLSQEDQTTISTLKQEIERAWAMVEASYDKEAKAKQTIFTLKTEINNLSKLVERGQGIAANQESTVNSLMTQTKDLLSHRDVLQASVTELNTANAALVAEIDKSISATSEGALEISSLREMVLIAVAMAYLLECRLIKISGFHGNNSCEVACSWRQIGNSLGLDQSAIIVGCPHSVGEPVRNFATCVRPRLCRRRAKPSEKTGESSDSRRSSESFGRR